MNEDNRIGSHRTLGSDHLVFKGGQVIIHTRVEMKNWELRKFRRPQILFEEKPYYIVHIDASGLGQIRYFLEEWGEHLDDIPGKTICYDEKFVRERDRTLKQDKKIERHSYFLLIMAPLLGFLCSDLKRLIEDQYGISSRVATRLSLYLEGICIWSSLVILTIMVVAVGIGPAYGANNIGIPGGVFLPLLILVLLPDLLVRFSRILSEDISPPGFYEWLVRRRRER